LVELPQRFVRDFLGDFVEYRFVSGVASPGVYHRTKAWFATEDFAEFARELEARSPEAVRWPSRGTFRLVRLRDIDGSEFPFILGFPSRHRRPLKCFVGHRFLPEIEGPLRYNLAHVLNPYQISLRWSAQDLSASGVFSDIVKGIRNSAMCFFDSYGTAGKPNVFIEIGMAYALGVPMIFTEHVGTPIAAEIPSDLTGLFRIQYENYEELFRKLYFGLPNFIAKNRIRAAAPRSDPPPARGRPSRRSRSRRSRG
jgi:hypothetical protein